MKREGEFSEYIFSFLDGIVVVADFIGHCKNNIPFCIGMYFALGIMILVRGARAHHKMKCLKEQEERNLARWSKRYANIKREMANTELLEDERSELLNEEADILNKIAEAKDKYFKMGHEIRRKNRIGRWISTAILLLLTLLNIPSFYAYAKERIETRNKDVVQGAEGDAEHDGEESPQGGTTLAENQKTEGETGISENDESGGPENSEFIIDGMTFYLDDPTLEWVPTPEMVAAVFYVNEDSLNIAAIVKQHMEELLNKNLKDTYNGYLSSAEESLADEASKQETDFDEKRDFVKKYAAENNYAKWRENLTHSTDLDNIIEKRLKLWESQKRNGTIASLIANNYQDYALEYQRQNRSGHTILSYYIETIIWSELALSYEGTDKEAVFKYIKGRYWDIVTCKAIPEEYRNNAYIIYLEMGQYEDYIK